MNRVKACLWRAFFDAGSVIKIVCNSAVILKSFLFRENGEYYSFRIDIVPKKGYNVLENPTINNKN